MPTKYRNALRPQIEKIVAVYLKTTVKAQFPLIINLRG